jgi:hypothetical protein
LFKSLRDSYKNLVSDFKDLPIFNENIFDAILAPIFFVLVSRFVELNNAIFVTGLLVGAIILYRTSRKESLKNALLGVIGTLIALCIARLQGSASGFFLPGIIRDLFVAFIGLVSVLFGKPFTIYTSKYIRGWPKEWFLHKKVKPAYKEVAIIWVLFLGLKGVLQIYFFNTPEILVLIKLGTSNQTTLLILLLTYLYGQKRLRNLGGPSVDEFKTNTPPPWTSQQSGF